MYNKDLVQWVRLRDEILKYDKNNLNSQWL